VRVLIVSNNASLVINIKEWFARDIESGKLELDIAKDREVAEDKLRHKSYDKIFHNGVFIIDAIEKYQSNVDVIHYGNSKNNIYSKNVEPNNKKQLKEVFKRPLYLGVNMKGIMSAIIALITFVYTIAVFANTLRIDVTRNSEKIINIERLITSGMSEINKKIDNLIIVKNDNNGRKK